jgi:hypothetical protein
LFDDQNVDVALNKIDETMMIGVQIETGRLG